jgi:acetyl-CoA C-acetyltransferase
LKVLAGEAVFAAMADAKVDRADALYVGNMLSGTISGQESLGPLIADWTGLRGIEAVKLEAACGSGAAALRAGLIAITSGVMDSVIVVGVEKMTDLSGDEVTGALATAADADYEAAMGLSFVAINALLMRRYMHEFGWQHADFAPFSINAHANAVYNPFARLHDAITEKQYSRARMVSDPINLLDASPTGDGAAAVVLVPAEEAARRRTDRPVVRIAASASATDSIGVHDRHDPMTLSAAKLSADRAYAHAGVGPADIDIFELHDAFSIMAAMSLEAAGFAERGRAPRLALEGQIGPTGQVPIATLGGLKARGHPVGATGIYQIVEVFQQLTGQAGPTQVPGAKIGMAQNIGGSGAAVITHILQSN